MCSLELSGHSMPSACFHDDMNYISQRLQLPYYSSSFRAVGNTHFPSKRVSRAVAAIWLLILTVMASTVSHAQQVSATPSRADSFSAPEAGLEVSTLMGEVLARHPSVVGTRYDREAAEKLVDVAERQFFPTPTVSMEAGNSRPTALFRLSQPIWTGGQLTGQLRVAELRRERAAVVADEVQVRLALRVLELCQNYVNNSGRVKTMRWTVHTLGQLTDMISRRADAEVSSVADRRVAEARLAQAQADLRGFMVAQRQAQDQLEQLLGASVNLERLNWRVASNDPRALPGYLEAALADWPSNRVARVDELIAKQEAVVAKAARWPVVSLAFEHRTGSQSSLLIGGYESNRVLLTTQYTLGAGLSALPQAEASELRAYSAAQAVGVAERLSADAIVIEWQAYQSALLRRQAQAEALAGAQDILASNRRLFVAGRRSWLDVVNSVREATQAEMAQMEIETVLTASQLRLRLLTGQQLWNSTESAR